MWDDDGRGNEGEFLGQAEAALDLTPRSSHTLRLDLQPDFAKAPRPVSGPTQNRAAPPRGGV